MINIKRLLISIGVSFLAGAVGSVFTFSAIPTWYAQLNKPFFNPPNWIFGPVWTTLYILIGIALYLIWNKRGAFKTKKRGYILFFIQLFLNALWSILFFGLHLPLVGFIEIIVLWISIVLTIFYFYPISRWASFLLIPYVLWVSFASILNLFITLLNK